MFGFPTLLFPTDGGSIITSLIGSFTSAAFNYFSLGASWGVFNSGSATRAVSVSSVVALAAHRESQVSDYRLESGSFASFNKVQKPLEIPIRITQDRSITARSTLLQWLETQVSSLSKFDIVTPERSYRGLTLAAYTLSREAGAGVSIIAADCVFQEVREVEALYSRSISDPNYQDPAPTTRAQTTATALSW